MIGYGFRALLWGSALALSAWSLGGALAQDAQQGPLPNNVVRTVGGAQPVGGNVPLPNTFTGTTCTGCTMIDPSLNGVPRVNGSNIVTADTTATAQGLAYFHRYANVTLTMPAIGVGGMGVATATVPGTAVGDQCFVAPTSTTTLLGYVMASGWVTTAGTVRVSLAATSLVAIQAGTVNVNMLCAQ